MGRNQLKRHDVNIHVLGPWSLSTSRTFWEGFTPAALPADSNDAADTGSAADGRSKLTTVFRVEADWTAARAEVSEQDGDAHIIVTGKGNLDAAAAQVARFLSLDIDARAWPDVAARDPVIADAQTRLPGLRPCGFHSPYEAAAWAVLSQRIRIVQASRLRQDLIARHGEEGAFPAPQVLRSLDLHLPGRKGEYLHAVAEAALEGRLTATILRSMSVDDALRDVQHVKGLGPFAAELVVIRGANAPDALTHHDGRLDAEITERYGTDITLTDISEAWRPFRSWAVVHLRALREQRTQEISRHDRRPA